MSIKKLQTKIDKICYGEKRVNDLQINYFGDEVVIYLDNGDRTGWKVSFIICDKVSYDSDASWTDSRNGHVWRKGLIRNMTEGQLGYDCQGIALSDAGNFIEIKIDLILITVNLQCKAIEFKMVNHIDMTFFWQNNLLLSPKNNFSKINIKKLQERIEAIRYHDSRINDFQINYFGDEVVVYFDNYDEHGAEDGTGWKISFLICDKVSYETDASWVWNEGHVTAHTRSQRVRDMTKLQLGYDGQDITLSEAGDFIGVKMDLTMMTVSLQCKAIEIEKVDNSEMRFFWENNVKPQTKESTPLSSSDHSPPKQTGWRSKIFKK